MEARTFLEPIDRRSLNLHYTPHERTLASVRMSWVEDALADEHLAPVVARSGVPESIWHRTGITSRLAVSDTAGAKLRMLPMFQELYHIGCLTGLRYNVISCRLALVKLFQRIGYAHSGAHLVDPVAGDLAIMVLDLEDLARIHRTITSPVLSQNRPARIWP